MRQFLSAFAGKDIRQLAPLILRLVIGFGFMAHGWAKFDRGPSALQHFLMQLHAPFPLLMTWVAILTELLGGLALFIGLNTRIVGDSDESDHSIPGQADHPFRGKLTRVFRAKVTTVIV